MSESSQAILSYIAVVVLLNLFASIFYIRTPARRIRAMRVSISYFRSFFLFLASGFVVFGIAYPKTQAVHSILIAASFLTAFFCLKYGFIVRQNPNHPPLYKSKFYYLNLLLIVLINGVLFQIYFDSHLMRSAFLTSNCSIIAILTLKFIHKDTSSKKYGESLAVTGVLFSIFCAMAMLLTLNYTQNIFTYFSVFMVSQSLIAILILGGSQAIFLSDLADLYYQESVTDVLTGLYNRRFFLRQSESLLKFSERHDYPISIILCDIDHFKKVNDKHGHELGDKALIEFANILKESSRDSDIIARFGGEEFIILLPKTDSKGALILAERMRAATEALTLTSGKKNFSITASFGVATFSHQHTIDEHIKHADTALYLAKSRGRNQVVMYEKTPL